jgi:hypothetical protein
MATAETIETGVKVGAQLNNAFVKEPCSLCDGWDRSGRIRFFVDNGAEGLRRTADFACDTCALKHAPDLVEAARRFIDAEDAAEDTGAYWGEAHEAVLKVLIPDGPDSVAVTIEQLEAAVKTDELLQAAVDHLSS